MNIPDQYNTDESTNLLSFGTIKKARITLLFIHIRKEIDKISEARSVNELIFKNSVPIFQICQVLSPALSELFLVILLTKSYQLFMVYFNDWEASKIIWQ